MRSAVLRILFAGIRFAVSGAGRLSTGRMLPVIATVTVISLGAGWGYARGGDTDVREAIRSRCEQLSEGGSLEIDGATVAADVAIPLYYRAHDYEPAWTDPGHIDDLLKAAEGMYNDGLNPEDYHYSRLRSMNDMVAEAAAPEPDLIADREILLMDSLLRIAYHVEFGKVDPERFDPSWNIHREFRRDKIVPAISEVLASGRLLEYIEEAKPQHQLYSCLKATLEKYRGIEAAGGWKIVPGSGVLKKGMSHENVIALRKRLAVTGDLPEGSRTDLAEFDEELEKGVIYFQKRHGLAADGVVGRASIEALNMPVEERIDQLRVNLERARWVLQDFADTFVLVNIAGFRVYYIVDNKVDWSARAQVGKTYRQTPVFKAEMEYLVFNPTWTVPPTILAKDVLPAIQKDVGYLGKKNMVVLDKNGRAVDPGSIEWSKYRGESLPYTIRQAPGPDNALGLIKFIFPNKHFVFLHDTPSRSLFDRAERAFSSGCIRVENPVELAGILLADKGYDQARISRVLDDGEPENVYLSRPVPTLLLYWTAFTGLEGDCNFRKDVYERDAAVLAALDGPVMLRKAHEAERDRIINELKNNR